MSRDSGPVNLEAMRDVTLAAAAAHSVDDVLRRIVDGIATCENVVLARIWLVQSEKDDRGERRWLQLVASNGTLRTPGADAKRLDGEFARVERGERKIGRIAASGQGMLLEGLDGGADWIARPGWARDEGVACFAGQPLVARGETLGVLALSSPLIVEPFLQAIEGR